jgi:hypothetical protein
MKPPVDGSPPRLALRQRDALPIVLRQTVSVRVYNLQIVRVQRAEPRLRGALSSSTAPTPTLPALADGVSGLPVGETAALAHRPFVFR